jgi:hypothetical protein
LALINYAEYFDLDGFNAAIKTLETTNKEFGTSVLSLNKEIKTSYNGVTQEIKGQIDLLQRFNVNQRDAGQELAKIGAESAKLRDRYRDQEAAMQGLLQVQDLSRASTKELKTAAKELQKQYESLGGASADIAAKKAVLAQEFRRITEAAQVQTQALKATKQVVDDAAGSYNALNKEALGILKQLKSMPNAFDAISGKVNENNAEAVSLSKRYIELNGTLKNIDAGLGNFQRNVGNYKSGFSGLSNSINQITREFPSFANSLQTGFLAISNNLPIFFDELQKTNAQLTEMRKQGQQTPTLFKALASSVLSFGTALSLGVTLLTLYGKDIVEFTERLAGGAKKIDTVKQSADSLVDAFKSSEYIKAIENVTDLRSAVDLAKQGIIDKDDVVKKYNDTIGKTTGIVSTLADVEAKLADKGDAFIEFTLKKARAQAILSKASNAAAEAEIRQLKGPSFGDFVAGALKSGLNPLGVIPNASNEFAESVKDANKAAEELDKLFAKLDKDANEFAKKNGLNILGNSKEEGEKELNRYKRLLDEKLKALKEEYDQEVIAAQKLLDEKRIDEVGFEQTKANAAKVYADKATAEETKANSVGFQARKEKLLEFKNFAEQQNNAYLKAVLVANETARKEDLELSKKAIEDRAELETISLKDAQQYELSNQRLTNEEKLRLELSYQNQLDEIQIKSLQDRAQYELDTTKRDQLLRQASILRRGIDNRNSFAENVTVPQAIARDQVAALKFVLEQRKLINQATIADELKTQQAIYRILKESGQLTIEQEREWELRLKKMTQEVNAYILSSLKDAANIVGNYLGTPFENVFNDITDVFLKLQDKAKITWDNIGQYAVDASNLATSVFKSNIDQQIQALEYQKEQELAAVGNNASAQAQINAKFRKEEAALKRKQAKADQQNALFQIGINTSEAVVKSIAASPLTFGLPFSAFALAAGALQATLVLSRQLPQFKVGTDNSPEGPAIVDEDGPELIIGPDGRIREVGGKGPRITYLEKGSKVKTAAETKRLLSNPETAKIVREMEMHNRSAASLMAYKQDAAVHAMTMALQNGAISEQAITSAFRQAVKEIPIYQTIIDREGERLRVIEGNKRTDYLNQFNIGRK